MSYLNFWVKAMTFSINLFCHLKHAAFREWKPFESYSSLWNAFQKMIQFCNNVLMLPHTSFRSSTMNKISISCKWPGASPLRTYVRGDFNIHGTKYFQDAVFHQKFMMLYLGHRQFLNPTPLLSATMGISSKEDVGIWQFALPPPHRTKYKEFPFCWCGKL